MCSHVKYSLTNVCLIKWSQKGDEWEECVIIMKLLCVTHALYLPLLVLKGNKLHAQVKQSVKTGQQCRR